MSVLDPITAAETDAQALRDIQLLERAAREWRWLAWLWVIGGIVFSVPLVVRLVLQIDNLLDGGNAPALRPLRQALFGLLFVLFFFGLVSSLYFLIARRIARGQRWAVGLALSIASVGAAATVAGMLVHFVHQGGLRGNMVMEAIMLLAHLNLLRVLFRSYGATLRIRQLARARMEEDAVPS